MSLPGICQDPDSVLPGPTLNRIITLSQPYQDRLDTAHLRTPPALDRDIASAMSLSGSRQDPTRIIPRS
eukprot:9101637-Pyramimonas_sp.AAC.1